MAGRTIWVETRQDGSQGQMVGPDTAYGYTTGFIMWLYISLAYYLVLGYLAASSNILLVRWIILAASWCLRAAAQPRPTPGLCCRTIIFELCERQSILLYWAMPFPLSNQLGTGVTQAQCIFSPTLWPAVTIRIQSASTIATRMWMSHLHSSRWKYIP